jgi:hypothetical protein
MHDRPLAVFGLAAADPELFEVRGMPHESARRPVELLARYVDQTFSWADGLVLLSADDDRRVDRLWTVDATLAAYRFSHRVAVFSQGNCDRENKLERETGPSAPSTKQAVEFSYRLG